LIAELPLGGVARFIWPHPGLQVLFRLLLQVKLHFFFQLTVELLSPQMEGQPAP